jgi:hypothetical protein
MKTNQVLFLTPFEENLFRELNKNQNRYDFSASSVAYKNLSMEVMSQFLNIGLLNKFNRDEDTVLFELSKLGKKLLAKKATFAEMAFPSESVYFYILD